MKKIVIVGAGYSGVLTAKKLAKKFKKDHNVTITIIDKNPFHTMLTELHEVAAGRIDEESIRINLDRIFAGRRVTVELDTVVSVDFDSKVVTGASKTYPYDFLVLAAGSCPTFFGIPGAKEFAYHLWSYNDAIRLRDRIQERFRSAIREIDPDEKKRLLTFYVIGAGFTGAEMTAELAEYVPILCDKFEIDPSLVRIFNVDVLPRMIPSLPEKLSLKIERRVKKMGVTLLLDTKVASIGEDYIELLKNGDSERFPAGTIIWVAGIESIKIANETPKILPSECGGRITVDSFLRSVSDSGVYAVGDNMYYIAPGEKEPVPQMVENCEQSAHTAAHNIYCAITGTGTMHSYSPKFHGVMVSAGGRYGVARVGLPGRMINLPSFFAMFVKHFINIVYFIQVLGWNKVFSYLKHEFFTIRNKRSFVGGHFSNRTPSFLLVPMRIWLGAVWLFEGIKKINEGWFSAPKLTGFFGGAAAWFDSILGISDSSSASTSAATNAVTSAATNAVTSAATNAVTSAATGVADAVSAATGAVAGSAGEVLFHFDILGLFRTIFVSGKRVAESAIDDFAFKLDVPVINLLLDKLVLPYSGVQLFAQGFIVGAEILIGLSLLGGLFTTLSSALSLVLLFMFVCTTGLYLGTFWMIFAAIAVLFGGGGIFGLDYYAIPALKKAWKKLPFVRRLYLYND